jgi:hypothetical protein
MTTRLRVTESGSQATAADFGSNLAAGRFLRAILVSPGVYDLVWADAAVSPAPATDLRYYVSKAGSDLTGNGSAAAPFLTIAAAMAAILDAAPAKRYSVLVGPGNYADDFVLKANTFVVGDGDQRTIGLTATNITLDATWTPNVDNWGGITNCIIDKAQTYDFDTFNSNQGKLYFNHVISNARQTFLAQSNINQVGLQDSLFFNGYTQRGINLSVRGCAFQNLAAIIMNSMVGVPTLLTAYGGGTDGALQLNFTPGHQFVGTDLFGFAVSGAITLNGVNAVVDGASLQQVRLGTGSPNGAVVGNVGDLYTNLAGGLGTTLYVKESGAGTNLGWVGK